MLGDDAKMLSNEDISQQALTIAKGICTSFEKLYRSYQVDGSRADLNFQCVYLGAQGGAPDNNCLILGSG